MTAACWAPRARHVGTAGHATERSTADGAIELRPWQTRREPRRLEIVDPGRWIDRLGGVAELHVRCFDVRIEVWCEHRDCAERRIESPSECVVTPLEIRSPWGATATSALDSSGVAIFFLDDVPEDAAPPAAALGWTVDGPDGQVAWRELLSPPSDAVPQVSETIPDASTKNVQDARPPEQASVRPLARRRSMLPSRNAGREGAQAPRSSCRWWMVLVIVGASACSFIKTSRPPPFNPNDPNPPACSTSVAPPIGDLVFAFILTGASMSVAPPGQTSRAQGDA